MVDLPSGLSQTDPLADAARLLRSGRIDDAAEILLVNPVVKIREIKLNAAVAGAYIKNSEFEKAVTFSKRAWSADVADIEQAVQYGWALRQSGRIEEAIQIFEQASLARPERLDLKKHLAGSLIQSGRLADAERLAADIAEQESGAPNNKYFHANILRQLGRVDAAAEVFRKIAEAEGSSIESWRHWLSFLLNHGSTEEAARATMEIAARWPEDLINLRQAAALLTRLGRFSEALAFSRRAVEAVPNDPPTRRQLSALLTQVGFHSEALDHAIIAVNDDPTDVEGHIFLAVHYRRASRIRDAFSELSVALAIDPNNRRTLFHLIELMKFSGQSLNAETLRQRALELHPGEPLFLAEDIYAKGSTSREFDLVSADESFDANALIARIVKRREQRTKSATPMRAALAAASTQRRVIWALLLREVKTRYGKSRIGYGWALIEPLTLLGVLGVFMAYTKSSWSPLGTHYIIFHYTGIGPYLLFLSTTNQLMIANRSLKAVLQFPMVQLVDVFIARALLEFIKDCAVCVLMFMGFGLAGYEYLPVDPLGLLLCFAAVSLIGFGVGMINCMIALRFETWEKLWMNFGRAIYLISGIFYISGTVVEPFRSIILWNPLLHAIDWFRSAFYPHYAPHLMSKTYLLGAGVASVALGFALERIMRKEQLLD